MSFEKLKQVYCIIHSSVFVEKLGKERKDNYKYIFQDTAELFFEDVRVPASNVVGDPTMGFPMMMKNLPLVTLMPEIKIYHSKYMHGYSSLS